jgi:transcriptional regulator with XRE-family HTH domain
MRNGHDARIKGSGDLGRWRAKRGLTQFRVAVQLEITPPYLSRIEAGRANPSASIVEGLAAILGKPVPAIRAAIARAQKAAA